MDEPGAVGEARVTRPHGPPPLAPREYVAALRWVLAQVSLLGHSGGAVEDRLAEVRERVARLAEHARHVPVGDARARLRREMDAAGNGLGEVADVRTEAGRRRIAEVELRLSAALDAILVDGAGAHAHPRPEETP